ncbi:peptidoglycan-binding domain-containing protein [Agromyces archimandritae]|uniref:Peptidoglycan-binding protein n=1 Tax=Agromyces archimandritae TaxID=2781962 RepID=A0A975FLT2_9MICO|nr:peptidoglycan-binding protein [Agromyces archimandritae]QTX03331.1 peptidoglycan-binding protein [Agromyces archimandritae]
MSEGGAGRRRPVWALGAVLVLAAGAGVGWAGAQVFAPRADVPAEAAFTFVELAEGEVGSSITLNTVAEWAQTPVGTNQATGTVTAVHAEAGAAMDAGAVLYDVELRPVVIAAGAVPAFRALSQGVEGADVAQLQSMLATLGLYEGEADGVFAWETRAAVEAWQDQLGLAADGVVQAGDLIFVPELPGRFTLDHELVSRGTVLAGGEAVLAGLSPEPVFTVPATTAQGASMPVGTRVEIAADGADWVAEVAGQRPAEDGGDQVVVILNGVEGASVCAQECELVPVEGQSLLRSRIVTQASVTGIVTPSAALRSDAGGAVSVIDAEGREHAVEVVASARGMSVITGADAGLRVRVPADAEAAG